MGRPFAGELSKMLDAIAQTLADQAAKPAVPATTNTPTAALVAPQQTVVPIPKPTISAPESLSPSFSPQPPRDANPTLSAVAKPAFTTATPTNSSASAASQLDQNAQLPLKTKSQAAIVTTSQATEQATVEQARAEQRLILKQRLADLVAQDKPVKQAKLRENLEATAIASAQSGQFLQARRLAQDQMLPPDQQAALLAQIDAIQKGEVRPQLEVPLKRSLSKPLPSVIKPLAPAVPGRSLPSVLPYTPPQDNTASRYVPQPPQEYVSYAFKGFGQTIGGFGVVIDENTTEFNGQSWLAAYATGNPPNAELWNGLSLIFPLTVPAPVTSGFGWRIHPINGSRRFHSGTDLGAPMGTPVLAAASGKVALSDWLGGYGLAVILSHQDDRQETLYGHLSQVFVKPGQWVEKGTIIGRVGSTGLSTGPHLHFELRQKTASGWQAIDPGTQLKYALARLIKAKQSSG